MPDPSLSVVMPLRGNCATTLAQQLIALADQDFSHRWSAAGLCWELVLADNGIDQETRALIERAGRQLLPGLRVVDATGRAGRGYALNVGVTRAASDLLVFLDADDVVDRGYLDAMYTALGEHSFVGARMEITQLNARWLQERREPLQEDHLEYLGADRPAVIGATMAVQRAAFEKVGGFDPELPSLEDLDLSWRLFEAGIEASFVPSAQLCYRYRTTRLDLFNQERSYARAEALLYRKHRGTAMERRRLRSTARGWLDVAAAVPAAVNKPGQARLATMAGAAVGRIEGSLRYGVLYL